MVTRDGTVKLLDFGTSKLLDGGGYGDSSGGTDSGVCESGTIAWGAGGDNLGRLLARRVRLLSGTHPFDGPGLERVMKQTDPRRPDMAADAKAATARSTTLAELRHRLRGDLASIVLKALAVLAGLFVSGLAAAALFSAYQAEVVAPGGRASPGGEPFPDGVV